MWNLATAPAWSDLIHVSLWNHGFLHSFCNSSKNNALGENFMKTKFILHKVFFQTSILLSRKTLWMLLNLCRKNCEKPFSDQFEGRVVSNEKNQYKFFLRNEVLNIFCVTIFSKMTAKNNFWGTWPFFREWGVGQQKLIWPFLWKFGCTDYGFEIFFSKNPIPAEWKLKNQFWGHTFPVSVFYFTNCFQKEEGSTMCGLAPTVWISWKSVQNCDLHRDSNNYYKLKI